MNIEVHSVAESNPSIDDYSVAAISSLEDTLLVAADKDFGELAYRVMVRIPGVILLEVSRLSLTHQDERVGSVLVDDLPEFVGRLTVAEPNRMRSRMLPDRVK